MTRTRAQPQDATNYPSGWTCSVVVGRLARYVAGELPRAEVLAIAEHVEACGFCLQRLALVSIDRRLDG